MIHLLEFNNPFEAVHVRKGRIIGKYHGKNGVTVVGKNHLLDVGFGGAAAVSPWYIGLISQSPTPVLSENDTLASHGGWTELTAYAGDRKEWVDAAAASKIKGTTTAATYVFTGTGTVGGLLIASVATTTSGVLWATGLFTTPIPVEDTDEIRVTYGVRL